MSLAIHGEEGVICCLMGDAKIDEVNDCLKSFMFEDVLLQRTFKLFADGTVTEWTGLLANLPKVEGMAEEDIRKRLLGIFRNTEFRSHEVRTYAKTVAGAYRERRSKEIVNNYLSGSITIDEMRAKIDELLTLEAHNEGTSAPDMAGEYEADYPKEAEKCGVKLGIDSKLDEFIGGVESGDTCLIGARPSVGKSALALQIAVNLARSGKRVGFFSLEMQKRSIYERLLAACSGLAMNLIRSGKTYDNEQLGMLDKGNEKIRELKNLIIFCGTYKVEGIVRCVKKYKLEAVFVDYLQLVKADKDYQNRTNEVGAISHGLKQIAMDYNIPVFPLVQLNRRSEDRDEPALADLRESGDLEQDASQVLLLWNAEEDGSVKNIKIAKCRNGQLGTVTVGFNGGKQQFISINNSRGEKENEDDFLQIDETGIELPFA